MTKQAVLRDKMWATKQMIRTAEYWMREYFASRHGEQTGRGDPSRNYGGYEKCRAEFYKRKQDRKIAQIEFQKVSLELLRCYK